MITPAALIALLACTYLTEANLRPVSDHSLDRDTLAAAIAPSGKYASSPLAAVSLMGAASVRYEHRCPADVLQPPVCVRLNLRSAPSVKSDFTTGHLRVSLWLARARVSSKI